MQLQEPLVYRIEARSLSDALHIPYVWEMTTDSRFRGVRKEPFVVRNEDGSWDEFPGELIVSYSDGAIQEFSVSRGDSITPIRVEFVEMSDCPTT